VQSNGSQRLGFFAGLPDGAPVPSQFQVFPWGVVEIQGSESFVVDGEAMSQVIERFSIRGLDMVIDYEHQTEAGSRAPAAGWIKRLEDRGKEGLWAVVEWTDRAREYLAKKEYRYFSPVFLVSKDGRRLVELLRVALTNAPRLNWIKPITAKSSINGNDNPNGREGMEFLELLAKQIGLPGTSSAEEISGEVGKLKEKAEAVVACKEVMDALGVAEGAGKSETVATIHALRQKPDLTLEVAALECKLAERDRGDLVAAALKDGKITPAQREWAEKYSREDLEGFRLFIAKAPRVVPLDRIDTKSLDSRQTLRPGDRQHHINKLLNISEETWNKYNE